MNSIVLQIAARYVRVILVIFALIALLRGHNHPGGGFIGGLLAAMSVIYYGFAYNHSELKKKMKIRPDGYIALGIALILLSIIPGLLQGQAMMQGFWLRVPLPGSEELKLGTPLLFDAGVFFAVVGVTLLFLIALTRQD